MKAGLRLFDRSVIDTVTRPMGKDATRQAGRPLESPPPLEHTFLATMAVILHSIWVDSG